MGCTEKISGSVCLCVCADIQVKVQLFPLDIIPIQHVFPSCQDELETEIWQQLSPGCMSDTKSPPTGAETLQHTLSNVMTSLL